MVSKTGTGKALNKKKAGTVASSRTAAGTRQTVQFNIYPSLKSLFTDPLSVQKGRKEAAWINGIASPHQMRPHALSWNPFANLLINLFGSNKRLFWIRMRGNLRFDRIKSDFILHVTLMLSESINSIIN